MLMLHLLQEPADKIQEYKTCNACAEFLGAVQAFL